MPKEYALTAVVLSFNSEAKITKCLESLSGWADEIILVDGESKDATLKIAEKFGVKVYVHPFLGSFAAERNFGIEKAKGPWVLQLDSDEIVTEEFKKKCNLILPNTKFAAFKFLRKNYFLKHPFKYGGWYHWSLHLLKKGYAHYEGRVHEKMIVNGEVGFMNAEILHFPFESISELIGRQNRYTDLQAQEILDTENKLDMKKIKYNLTLKPLKLFKKMYFNKKGYKEGMYGFIFSVLFVFVHFLKWSKVWEKARQRFTEF